MADSQALKADSLDFIGDGSITLVGLMALAWAASTRARVAMTQGLFLGALGVGVIAFALLGVELNEHISAYPGRLLCSDGIAASLCDSPGHIAANLLAARKLGEWLEICVFSKIVKFALAASGAEAFSLQ